MDSINIKHLTENPWISTETDCTRIFSFDEKSKYKYYFENAEIVTEEEGKYVFNEKDNTLKLYTDSGYESFDFKVLKLSQSEVWLRLFDFIENKYPSTPGLKLKAATEKDNIPPFISGEKIGFTISSPTIDDITANSAKIKGTIHTTGNENSAEMGVCYSKNETPTINDK